MAREYASICVRVWQDDDFRALPRDAQMLYFTCLTLPNLSYCGVFDWRPKKIVSFADDWSPKAIEDAATILQRHLYVVVDDVTEEALIRSFIRNDGLLKQPRMAVSMARAYGAVGSRTLQGVIVHELKRLYQEAPGLLGWHKPEAFSLLSGRSVDPSTLGANVAMFGPNDSALLPSPFSSSLLHAPSSGLHDSKQAQTADPPNQTPQATTTTGKPVSRGTRIPENFTITQPMRDWATKSVPGMDIDHHTQRFVLHFQAASGQRATMVSWEAAWKKWMLGDYAPPKPSNGRASPASPTRHDENAEAVHRMQQREEAMRNGTQPHIEIGTGK